MRTSERTLAGEGGTLFVRRFEPDGSARAVVVIAHGFAEHGGRYASVATRLVDRGFAVVAGDHRGHGRSAGKRRSIRRFDDYVDDLRVVIDAERRDAAAAVLLGHSMGGLIALSFAVQHADSLTALAVSAPAACPGKVSRLTVLVGRMVSATAPDMGVLRLPLQRISKDPAVVEAYMQDPLVFRGPLRARLGAEMLETMRRVDAALPALRLPLLAMQGDRDGLVEPGCARHVWQLAGSPDKTLREYPGLWHEIFNEPERDMVINDLIEWLEAHTPAAS